MFHLLPNRDICCRTGTFLHVCLPVMEKLSYIQHALSSAVAWRENAVVLVETPLVMIMEDRVKTQQSRGVAAAYGRQDPDMDE